MTQPIPWFSPDRDDPLSVHIVGLGRRVRPAHWQILMDIVASKKVEDALPKAKALVTQYQEQIRAMSPQPTERTPEWRAWITLVDDLREARRIVAWIEALVYHPPFVLVDENTNNLPVPWDVWVGA